MRYRISDIKCLTRRLAPPAIALASLLAFTSPALAVSPVATTSPATPVHHTDAVLRGHLDPGTETITACHFEWGADTSYAGGTLPCDQGQSFGSAADVTATLSFLTDGVTYHFRLVVTGSSSGTVQGADQSFITPGFSVEREVLGSFGSDGTSGSAFSPVGALAFNTASEALFAPDSSGIWGFDVSSPLNFPQLSGFNPLSDGFSPGGIAVDPGTGNVYVAGPAGVNDHQHIVISATGGTFKLCFKGDCTPDLAYDTPARGFDITNISDELTALPSIGGVGGFASGGGSLSGPGDYTPDFSGALGDTDVPQITCDGSNLTGGTGCSVTTITQGKGDQISGFDSSGNPLGGNFPIDTSAAMPSLGTRITGLAVDSAGHLWAVNRAINRILEYSSAGSFLGSVDISAQFPEEDAEAFAIDADDNLYAGSLFSTGLYANPGPNEGVWRYSAASGYTDATKIYNGSVGAIAFDSADHHMFLSPRATVPDAERNEAAEIREYDAAGNLLGELGREIPSAQGGGGRNFQGLAVDGANHYLYATLGYPANQIYVFGPPNTVELPTLTAEPAGSMTGDSATLLAKVDPEGNQVSDCHFQYGAEDESGHFTYTDTAPCASNPGLGSGDVEVSADVGDLNGGTTYHFRIVAVNANGTAKGSDGTFTTLGPQVHASAIDWGSVTASAAGMQATINPEGEATTYHVEYGTTTAYGQSTTPQELTTNGLDQQVSQVFGGLLPATTFHLRVVATNASGTNHGPDLVFTTYPAYGSESCPNEAFRTGPSAGLSDCRAYEQASPVDKNGGDVQADPMHVQASLNGDAVTMVSQAGLPGGFGSEDYPTFVAHRGDADWSTTGLMPPSSFGSRAVVSGWTPDLAYSFASSTVDNGDADGSSDNGMVMQGPVGHFQQIVPPTNNVGYHYAGASADDSKVFFEAEGDPLPVSGGPSGAAGKDNLYVYDRDTGDLRLVGVLPGIGGGPPPGGSFAGPYDWFSGAGGGGPHPILNTGGAAAGYFTQDDHSIASGGEKAFFTAANTGEIYMRLNPAAAPSPVKGSGKCTDPTLACTVKISAAQGFTDPNGAKPKLFMAATPSGSVAYFTSCEKLTPGSTAVSDAENRCDKPSEGADLYAYDTATGSLADLTVDGADPIGAQVQNVIGASTKGDFVYFVANGVLASNAGAGGAHATLGDCAGYRQGVNSRPVGSGECNLYVWHAGEGISFIAPLNANGQDANGNELGDGLGDLPDFEGLPGNAPSRQPAARVSADGRVLVFGSVSNLAGIDTHDTRQFYRYSYGEPSVACITCNPAGNITDGVTLYSQSDFVLGFHAPSFLTRNLSADGKRFFFETGQKLVPADTNSDGGCSFSCVDPYEWETNGSGSCHTAPGCYYLLSAGTGDHASTFMDASLNGDDVFVLTRDQLVPSSDTDSQVDIYDVRVGGGLASQHEARPPQCEGEACRGAGTSPASSAGAGTASFSGTGNRGQTRSRDCGTAARKALRLARASKSLRRRAEHTQDPQAAADLRRRASAVGKRAQRISGGAKRCRRANQDARRESR